MTLTFSRRALAVVSSLALAISVLVVAPPAEAASFVPIYDIQGSGQFSPYEGAVVQTTGVVTAIQSNGRDGWIQDPDGDGDDSTSDGIFVDDFDDLINAGVAVGDLITIEGDVEEREFFPFVALPLTRIDDPVLISNEGPADMPDPVELKDLPNTTLADGITFWEALEGMLVEVKNGRVTSATNDFGEWGMLAKKDAKPGSGYYPQSNQIIIRSLGGDSVDYNPERIMVDDATTGFGEIQTRPGDKVKSLTAIVDYTFSMYKLQPLEWDITFQGAPAAPVSKRSGGGGNFTVTTFNVENLFDLEHLGLVDAIGEVDFDPGSQWGSGLTSTKDNTIRRMNNVCAGDDQPLDPFDPAGEWDGFANNTFGGLGSHDASGCPDGTTLLFSEYVEGSSFNKAVEIYNGTGAAVDLEGYFIQLYQNGSDRVGELIPLTGTVADGAVHVVAHEDASFAGTADQTTGDLVFNGDDAVLLRLGNKNDTGTTPSADRLETQLTKLALAIELELKLPDIIVAQEVENQGILQELGDRVNAANGTAYTAVGFETSDERGIEVGFLYDLDRVNIIEAHQMTGAAIEAAFGPDSPSPGREPLVGTFQVRGTERDDIIIIGNHFKSKSGDNPLYGKNDPPIRITEVQRHAQAEAVRDYVNVLLDANPNQWLLVTGDFNDFQFAEPGEGTDTIAILEGGAGEVKLLNVVDQLKAAERWSFVFDGNSQVLDHMLLSPALEAELLGADFLHFNTPYTASLSNDPSTPLVSSDHDALEARFQLTQVKVDYILTVLHNNDGESNLVDAGTGLEDFGGVARFATVVADAKAAATPGNKNGAIMVSSGDNFLAGPEFNASLDAGIWYDAIALDMLGYDAIQLGNHDFDFGPDTLAAFISEGFSSPGTPPYIAANLDFSAEPALQALADAGVIVGSTVVEEDGKKFGITGVVTPNLPFISSPGGTVVDPALTIVLQAEIDALEADGIDRIILISHLQGVDEDIDLAATLEGVDVMVAGGGDEVLANPGDLLVPGDTPFGLYPLIAIDLNGTAIPVVTTAGNYKYLGALSVDWDKSGNVIGWTGGPIRVSGVAPDAVAADPVMQAAVVDPVSDFLDLLASTEVATTEVGLDAIRSHIRSVETNEGNLIADAYFWQATQKAAEFGVSFPDVALTNGGGIRNDSIIPAGSLTVLDTFSMLPFGNFIAMVEHVSRDDFKALLENAVSRMNADGTSSGSGTGRFAQISGFTMEYDSSLAEGSRVLEVVLDAGSTTIVSGGAVVAGGDLTIATNAFSASGGDEWFGGPPGAPFTTLGVTDQQTLQNFLEGPLAGLVTAAAYPEDAGIAGSCMGARIINTSGACVDLP